MKALVTGGAGFIGRWVVKKLFDRGIGCIIIDDLSSGSEHNIEEFKEHSNLLNFEKENISNKPSVERMFSRFKPDICFHLAARINVQQSIDNPHDVFNNEIIGTFNILEACRKYSTKLVLVSTCMVYAESKDDKPINEGSETLPRSPYAGMKLACENLATSYFHAYRLPVTVLRPFNTYGPFQRADGEGGVVAIFLRSSLMNEPLKIYGDGTQTRDLLFVEDCADFIIRAAFSNSAHGEIINAGLGQDISINDLASLIAGKEAEIIHVPHIHPQSEIMKLLCDNSKAKQLLGWEPETSLTEGINKTREWLRRNIQ
ncbi:MAG: GDP-mannose 4,6-dehydratase [Actinobacteria bacterium]|nr:GDP-mannose 4,6-dehydratase [Actinomycetota bacterium]